METGKQNEKKVNVWIVTLLTSCLILVVMTLAGNAIEV